MTCFHGKIDFQLFAVFVVSSIVFGCGCDSYVIHPKKWEYKSRFDIGYEVATSSSRSRYNGRDMNEPILLLNGFGVGSFHQHRLIPEILKRQNDNGVDGVSYDPRRIVYCLDYLGQGKSWPKDCQDGKGESEKGLQYSADT